MPIEIVTIPCRADNYAYLLHNGDSGATALIDAPEAAPIAKGLSDRGWALSQILLTHHHYDHVEGLAPLRSGATVIGAQADSPRLPALDQPVSGGARITLAGAQADIIDVPGHTIGHIAVHLPSAEALFTADSLMTMGCGRLFEGTPAQMWDSLLRLRALPPRTRVFTGHEYTATNIAFALSVEPENPALAARAKAVAHARASDLPTTGATLAEECATNPFLRADQPDMARALGMEGAPPVEIFAHLRARRDKW